MNTTRLLMLHSQKHIFVHVLTHYDSNSTALFTGVIKLSSSTTFKSIESFEKLIFDGVRVLNSQA